MKGGEISEVNPIVEIIEINRAFLPNLKKNENSFGYIVNDWLTEEA